MEKIIEKLMEQAEDCLKEYSKKPEWTPQDLECAYKAACMYDKLQTIKMNNGIWDQIKDDVMGDEYSSRNYPTVRYGTASYARGRDAMTGRYVSRRGGQSYRDGYRSYGDDMGEGGGSSRRSYAGGQNGGNTSQGYYEGSNGRSSHSISDQMVQKLEMLMDQAGSEYERKKVEEVIRHIEDKG